MVEANSDSVAETPPYFAVSLLKLSVMSTCTFGLYELWWFYKNWCRIRRNEQSDISPAWRAVLSIIWCYSCLKRIRSSASSSNLPVWLPAGPLAAAWIVTELLYKLPDPWWLISLFTFVWLLPAQVAANRINRALNPGHDPNATFSGWNVTAIAIGSFMLIFGTLAMILPPE